MKLVTLSYADSPTHGRGREWTIDGDGSVTGHVGGGFWETVAFYFSRVASANPRDWRENFLISHDTSGLSVISSIAISRLRRGIKPPRVGKIIDGKFVDIASGRLYLWELPKHTTTYVVGADLSQGVEASNTVLAVMDRNTGKIVAEYVDPSVDAHEAAPIAIELGHFYGPAARHLGISPAERPSDNALLIWEVNGPGIPFGREIVRSNYFPIYQQRDELQSGAPSTKRYGWLSTPQNKELLFTQLSKSSGDGTFKTYSEAGLDDMAAWLWDEHGRIVCGAHRDETTGAQARHGDRCIAYALCNMAREYMWKYEPPEDDAYPPGSFGRLLGHQDVRDAIESGEYG